MFPIRGSGRGPGGSGRFRDCRTRTRATKITRTLAAGKSPSDSGVKNAATLMRVGESLESKTSEWVYKSFATAGRCLPSEPGKNNKKMTGADGFAGDGVLHTVQWSIPYRFREYYTWRLQRVMLCDALSLTFPTLGKGR